MLTLTADILTRIPVGTIFASGITINNREGCYMTENNKDHHLMWIAKKGHGHNDWAIYVHWIGVDQDYVAKHGQKVAGTDNIKRLVPCTEEVFKSYRY